MNDLINLFKTLAHIDSPSGEESDVATYILDFLRGMGLEPELDAHGMVYCRVGSGENPVLFCAHMDTVEPGRGIEVIEEDGVLHSAGSTIMGGDNKISLATILFTVKKLLDSGVSPNIELLFSVREETDSGIRLFDVSRLESKTGFVFDGGKGSLEWVVTKASTIEDFVLTLTGKSSHASRPEDGTNVLEVFCRLGNELTLGRIDPQSTFNIGKITGGDATNTVPSKLVLEGDLRSSSIDGYKRIKDQIVSIITELGNAHRVGVKFRWIPYTFGYELSQESPAYTRLQAIYSSLGITLAPTATTSGSDAGFLNASGIETFCLGDGVVGTHTVEEHIERARLQKLAEIVEHVMVKFHAEM
ncbi:MAG: M20/M25/M40 family metallo-hydrolase [Candidatus Dojkabacteria bacterium]